jgi:hypothetical protein
MSGMARRADELHEAVVVEIDDEFRRLSPVEQHRRAATWLEEIDGDEPYGITEPAAALLAEVRAEDGWA